MIWSSHSLLCSLPHPPALPPSVLGGRWQFSSPISKHPPKVSRKTGCLVSNFRSFCKCKDWGRESWGKGNNGRKRTAVVPARNHHKSTQLVPILSHPTANGLAQGFALSADIRKRDGDFFSFFLFIFLRSFLTSLVQPVVKRLSFTIFIICFFCVHCVLKRKKTKNGQIKKKHHFLSLYLISFSFLDSLCS